MENWPYMTETLNAMGDRGVERVAAKNKRGDVRRVEIDRQVTGKPNMIGLPKMGNKMTKSIVASLPILVTLVLSANSASVQYKEVGGRSRTAGLFTDKDCSPAAIQGKVVKRDFAKNGVSLGIRAGKKDGSRTFVNVEIPDDLNMVDLGYVTQGLQTLIREGRYIHGGVRACGAAGRFLTLERVK